MKSLENVIFGASKTEEPCYLKKDENLENLLVNAVHIKAQNVV